MDRFLKPTIRIQFTLTLWNPTIHPVTHLARVPVTKEYTIRDPVGQTITAEVIETNEIDRLFDLLFYSLKYLPISLITARIPGRTSSANHQLVFKAEVPALGFSTFFFEVKSNRIQLHYTRKNLSLSQILFSKRRIERETNIRNNTQ
jgi:hypothetical protein